jgi:hypothetical protein
MSNRGRRFVTRARPVTHITNSCDLNHRLEFRAALGCLQRTGFRGLRGKRGDSPNTKELSVSDDLQTTWSNRYNAQLACEHCSGIIRHEAWCITLDPVVYYAYQMVADPSKLTIGDVLILHSLGVIWGRKTCTS